ncbi:hypothetical protein CYLTODRAFT_426471, partial [Cylindrobasidium torrendii FP15055 ss-10]
GCDGAQPICTNCSISGKGQHCLYKKISESGPPARLDGIYTRNVCKCDAKRPQCSTCLRSPHPNDCRYDLEQNEQERLILQARIRELEAKLRAKESPDLSEIVSNAEMASPPRTAVPPPPLNPIPFTVGYTDADLRSLRELILTHRGQLGLCLTQRRIDALRLGDTSTLHPAVIHAVQLLGSFVNTVELNRDIDFRKLVQSTQLSHALRSLSDMTYRIDSTSAIETHCLLATYYLVIRDVFKAREQILCAAHRAISHNIHIFNLAQTITQGFTSSTITISPEEDIGALSEALFMDQHQNILFKTTILFPDYLYNELRTLPPVYKDFELDAFCIICRAVSLLYFRDADALIAKSRDGKLSQGQVDLWNSAFHDLVGKTDQHLSEVRRRLTLTEHAGDDLHTRALKLAEMLSLCYLLRLHSLFTLTNEDSHNAAVDALERLVLTTSSFKDEDYFRLDPIMNVIWNECTTAIRNELAAPTPFITGETAGEWIGIINHHADLLSRKIPFIEVH